MKQSFFVIVNEDEEEVFTEIYEFNTLEGLNCKLDDLTYGNIDEESIHVYHGAVISAEAIPNTLNGTAPFIIVRNPDRFLYGSEDDGNEVLFTKGSSDPSVLMDKIEDILTKQDAFPGSGTIKLDDIDLLFGYRMMLVLQATEGNLDEEVLDRASKICSAAAEVKRAAFAV